MDHLVWCGDYLGMFFYCIPMGGGGGGWIIRIDNYLNSKVYCYIDNILYLIVKLNKDMIIEYIEGDNPDMYTFNSFL